MHFEKETATAALNSKPRTGQSLLFLPARLLEQRRQILANPGEILRRPGEWVGPLAFALGIVLVPCLIIETCTWSLNFVLPGQTVPSPLLATDEEKLQALTQQLGALNRSKPDSKAAEDVTRIESDLRTLTSHVHDEQIRYQLAGGMNLLDELVAFPLQFFVAATLFKFLVSRLGTTTKEAAARADDIYLYYFPSCALPFLLTLYAGLAVVKVVDACQLPQLQNELGESLLGAAEFILAGLPLIAVLRHTSTLTRLLIKARENVSWRRNLVVGAIFLACVYLSDFLRLAALCLLASGWVGILG